MNTILISVWLILYGIMGLVSMKVPEWILPLSALVMGLVVLAGGVWKRNP